MHILLITRHYPPEISGGARRPALYVKALRELGHRVTVVTPFKIDDEDSICVENAAINRGRIAAITSQQVKSSLFDLIKNHLRVWRYWPDDNAPWAKDVIRALTNHDLKPDWIFTTSPPESVHSAGAALSNSIGRPWLAEMRDTWVEVPHRDILVRSKLRAFIERRIAKKTLSQASAITAVSEAVMQEGRKYTAQGTPECIISHFSHAVMTSSFAFDETHLNLVHTGGMTLSDRRRILTPLLKDISAIATKRPEVLLHIAGPLSPEEIREVESHEHIKWHGSIPMSAARAMQNCSDGLVLYTPEQSHALPGKFAEYAQAGRPILVKGGGNWTKLVNDPSLLRPLVEGAMALSKGEVIKPSGLTNKEAAKQLATFLESLT